MFRLKQEVTPASCKQKYLTCNRNSQLYYGNREDKPCKQELKLYNESKDTDTYIQWK